MRVQLGDQLRIVDLKPLAGGGEADVYELPGAPHHLAKVYKDGRAQERRDKVAWMIRNPPWDPPSRSGHRKFSWPEEVLLDPGSGAFLGYTMPRVEKAAHLFEIANPVVRPPHAASYEWRLEAAMSLARVAADLHALGHVIGDVSASNWLVNAAALVTLIDTDSFQINTGSILYRCLVGTPEFTAPKLQGVDLASVDRTPAHDAFGIAILIYLLLAGVHPYQGRYLAPGRQPPIHECIRKGFWPNAPGGFRDYEPSPCAPPFESHHPALQERWTRCFFHGHRDETARPTPADWVEALEKARAEGHPVVARIGLTTLPSPHRLGTRLRGRTAEVLWRVVAALRPVPLRWSIAAAGAALAFLAAVFVAWALFSAGAAPSPRRQPGTTTRWPAEGLPDPPLWQEICPRDPDDNPLTTRDSRRSGIPNHPSLKGD
jgi:DNA-binding helix-hairpin-helix protein with protein kinase domain